MSHLRDEIEAWRESLAGNIGGLAPRLRLEAVGHVQEVGDGVARVTGLPKACLDELVYFENGVPGIAILLEEDSLGCILLGPEEDIRAGTQVRGTGSVVRVPVGESLLGRVIDPVGRALDGGEPLNPDTLRPIEQPAPDIMERDLVNRPLNTGLAAVDAMVPLGRGQRELIIGDRSTGKTAIAVDTMINQRSSDVISIYVGIGQRASTINGVVEAIEKFGAKDRTIFVVAEADSPAGLQWIAPYAACTVAEYFMRQGRDVLVVYDDLTQHAAIYRQLTLLLRFPPGREAYPGDIFYVHSRLLERAAQLSREAGGGSMTALPIIETQSGNLSAYIPTNLISITDGQIYLERKLFNEGVKPAVNVGKSISRVGGKTQSPALKRMAESLRLKYVQFGELEIFTRFSAVADEGVERTIRHGRRIRSVLCQPQYHPLSISTQVALFLALDRGYLDTVDVDAIEAFRARLSGMLQAQLAPTAERLDSGEDLSPDELQVLDRAVAVLARDFSA